MFTRLTSPLIVFMLIYEPTSAEPPPDIDEIAHGIGESRRLFLEEPDSIRISFAIEKVTAYCPEGEWTRAEYVAARKGTSWYNSENLFDVATGRFDDKRVYASKQGKALSWRTFNRSCMISPANDTPNVALNWTYTQVMGFSVYEDIARSNGVDYDVFRKLVDGNEWTFDRPYLPDCIDRNASNYRVLPMQEVVDGFPCWVVESAAMDRLVVDVVHGFAIRRRSYHWGHGKPLRYNIWQKDFREVRGGLWLPHRQIVEECGKYPDGDEKWWGKPINRVEYSLKEVSFNSIGDDFFDIHLPPGTRVVDFIQKNQYTVAAEGGDAFEDAFATADKLIGNRRTNWWFVVVFLMPPLLLFLWIAAKRRGTVSKRQL